MFGKEVELLQQLLSNIPGVYPEAKVTGYFGSLTLAAVKRYQCKYNIVCAGNARATGWGVIGPKTRALLNGE
jgi:peptidoglycan hydrolase-like protein with peptidoglycan-binding domain